MADTKGLLKTRGEYTEAVTEGKTDKSHADWYAEKHKAEQAEEVPYNARWRDRPLSKMEK